MMYPVSALESLDAWILQASEEELAAMGLFPGDDAAYAAEAMGTDAYTMENIIISGVQCNDGVEEEGAATLAAAGATLLAVALLN